MERLLNNQQAQLLRQQRELLWEALQPVAQAMRRLEQSQQPQHKRLQLQEELLMEVLNSLQPSASQQIFPLIGQQNPPHSSHDLAS
jgi:hypothetical protein